MAPVQKERQVADKRTVETADRLHDMIESELEALEGMKERKCKFGGDPGGGAGECGQGASDSPGRGGI